MDPLTAIGDLIVDLLHLADTLATPAVVDAIVSRAIDHHAHEADGGRA